MAQDQTYRQYAIEEYILREEPFYIPVSDEVELFEAAYASKIPVLLNRVLPVCLVLGHPRSHPSQHLQRPKR